MQRRAFAQVRRDLAPVQAQHAAIEVEDREYDGAVEVLVAALTQDAEPLQAPAQLRAFLAVPVRQRQPELAIGEAQLEVVDHLRIREAAALQVPQRFPASL